MIFDFNWKQKADKWMLGKSVLSLRAKRSSLVVPHGQKLPMLRLLRALSSRFLIPFQAFGDNHFADDYLSIYLIYKTHAYLYHYLYRSVLMDRIMNDYFG